MTVAPWQNRIVRHGTEAPDQLLANPDNWRVHPLAQQEALSAALDKVGFVQSIVVNERTGYVVDGHLRVSLAISRHEPSVPVTYVNLTESEEALVLATFDPLSVLAVADDEKLADLLDLLPDEGLAIARLLHAERQSAKTKLVEFEATESYTVTVECENETQQAALVAKLRQDGYTCRAE